MQISNNREWLWPWGQRASGRAIQQTMHKDDQDKEATSPVDGRRNTTRDQHNAQGHKRFKVGWKKGLNQKIAF